MNANEITVIAEDYNETAIKYLKGMGMNLPQKYATQFVELCKANQLNPFKRECYAVGYGDNWNIITGYEVYIKRAERTGKLDGWECKVEGEGDNKYAELVIYRKDWSHPFHHYVYFAEAVQKKRDGSVNSMWAKMPSFMLRKVCIAQGFRLCFPDELGGMPYTSDELPEVEQPPMRDVTPTTEKVVIEETEKQSNDFTETFYNLLNNYKDKLGVNYETAYNVFQGGNLDEMTAMYNRCVSYLSKKGIKVM